MRQLEEPERRAKFIRYDDQIQKLCGSFDRQTNVIHFLKKVANVCQVYVICEYYVFALNNKSIHRRRNGNRVELESVEIESASK